MDGRVQTNWEREMNYQVLKVCDDDEQEIVCPNCDGSGEIECDTTTGGFDSGGSPWVEIRGGIEQCGLCDGEGTTELFEGAEGFRYGSWS